MVKVRHSEGVAIHTDPESCAGYCREAAREALTGGRTCEVLSGESNVVPGEVTLWLDRFARDERVHKAAHFLALRENRKANLCGMDKFADQEALWLDRIAWDERVHKAAHVLALRQNGRTAYCRMDKFADQATEMETGIWHDDFPFFKVRVPVIDFHAVKDVEFRASSAPVESVRRRQ